MSIEDRSLPAVAHLTGGGAGDVLDAAVTAAGGCLHGTRVVQVQYRPGHDIVVRYRADVTWPGAGRKDDTLFASARAGAAHPGAIPVVADTDDGPLEVSVWRWPHDPVLSALPLAVTARDLQATLGPLDPVIAGPGTSVEVVAFRPTERAVIRVTSDRGTRYVKVVPPVALAAIVERHHRLGAASLPVPPVVATDEALGLLVMGELAGTTLRDRIKGGLRPWASPDAVDRLLGQLAAVPIDDLPPASSRLRDALGHADLLRLIAPETTAVLARVTSRIAAVVDRDTDPAAFVHGDLHEAQVVVDEGGAVTGLLDIDDVGAGDRLADRSTLLGHLRFRALTAPTAPDRRTLVAYADTLRSGVPAADHPELDLRIAAVLVGLATGPFRIQRPSWRDEVTSALALADELSAEHEEVLKSASSSLQTAASV